MATAQTSIHVKVDPTIKTQSETILNQIGISMSDLINMTLRRVIYERRIPFDTTIDAATIPDCLNVKTETELQSLLEQRLATKPSAYIPLDKVQQNINLATK